MDTKKTVKQAAKLLGIKGKLKKAQSEAINDGLNGHDLLVIAPTSFGKSAVFQILALLKGGLSIVVVPTLSLLHDQAEQLQQLGLQAEILASDCDLLCEEDICEIIRQYGHLILYTTPESLWKLELLHTPVSLLIADECHCVVSWGYGFRKDYLKIGIYLEQLNTRPQVISLTVNKLKSCSICAM